MGYFKTDLITKRLDPRWEQLIEPLIYRDIEGEIVVPRDFITDYASSPWLLQNTFNRKGKMGLAGVVHDWLYFTETGTRKNADKLFMRICKEQGMGRVRAYMAYLGVRIGAGRHFGGKADVTMKINDVWHTKRGTHWMPMKKEDFQCTK